MVFGLPLIVVCAVLGNGEYGYFWSGTGCFFNPRATLQVPLFFMPIAIGLIVGVVFMGSVMVKILYVMWAYHSKVRSGIIHPAAGRKERSPSGSGRVSHTNPARISATTNQSLESKTNSPHSDGNNPFDEPSYDDDNPVEVSNLSYMDNIYMMWDILKILRTPLIFVIFFLCVYASFFALTMVIVSNGQQSKAHVVENFNKWGNCVLTHYNGIDGSWLPFCGEHLAESQRFPFSMRLVLSISFAGQGLFIAGIHFPAMIIALYVFFKKHLGATALRWWKYCRNCLRMFLNCILICCCEFDASSNSYHDTSSFVEFQVSSMRLTSAAGVLTNGHRSRPGGSSSVPDSSSSSSDDGNIITTVTKTKTTSAEGIAWREASVGSDILSQSITSPKSTKHYDEVEMV